MAASERQLRRRVKELEQEVDELRLDRQIFRDHFALRFRWWVELMGKGERPNLAWLVENDARVLTRVKYWPW